jgi:hypothetical protein
MLMSQLPLFARLRNYLLIAAGLALIAASVAWDLIRGADSFSFGRKQLAGCLAGVALLAMGVWLGRAGAGDRLLALSSRRPSLQALRWVAILLLLGGAGLLSLWLPRESLYSSAAWILWAHILALCLILPMRLGWSLLLIVAALNLSLAVIDTIKVGLTGLPLTMLDIRIAAANPTGLWEALHLPAWSRYATQAGIVLVGLYVLYQMAAALRLALASRDGRRLARRLAVPVAGITLLALLTTAFLHRLFETLGANEETWDMVGVTAMANEIGVLPYLAYSQHIESTRTGDFFRSSIGSEPPPAAEVREAVLRHVDFGSAPAVSALPNIVILLAESTFDPNRAFRLNQQVRSSLFEPGKDTVAVGPFRVNVIGGGTWVTEFETIVGLDSRLFGYAGYYTHSSLSPYVTRSLFMHLESQGYRTSVFFPNDSQFYNYRNAYRAYGADRIFDRVDQRLPDGWLATDTQIIDEFTRIMGPRPAAPFLSYVMLNENHGPHACRVARIDATAVRFADTAEFAPNCVLHEYLRRLKSTEAAVALLVNYLRGIEARDGRPFALLIFGDHQPYTFTGSEWSTYDFAPLRTSADTNDTFFHLISSLAGRLKCCLRGIPATLVPTLLSAYAAKDADEVYLGINLWLFDQCGPDAIASGSLSGLFRDQHALASTETRTEACAQAYMSALTAFRQMDIIAGTTGPAH